MKFLILTLCTFFGATLFAAAPVTETETELITNGSFEQGTKDWDHESWNKIPEPGGLAKNAHKGKYCYKMHCNDPKSRRLLHGNINIAKDTPYRLKLYLKCDQVPAGDLKIKLLCHKARKVIGWACRKPADGVNTLLTSGGSHDWKEFSITLDPGCFPVGSERLLLFIERGDNTSGNVFIDDVSMSPAK